MVPLSHFKTLKFFFIFFKLDVRDVLLFSAGGGAPFWGEGHNCFHSSLGEGHKFFQGFLGEGHNFFESEEEESLLISISSVDLC